jgi:hypothetical protein
MAAGTAYSKRYGGGFSNGSVGGTAIDATFLNAVEEALLQLLGAAPTADAQVMQWDFANTRYGPALLLNKNIDPAAAIAKSKLDLTGANGIVNADIAAAAAIAKSKLDFGSGLVNADIATAAAIALSKLANVPVYAPYRKTTAKAVNTTTAATDLLNGEITIAANVMGATGTLRLTAFGDFLNNSGGAVNNARFQLLFGGTTIFDTDAGTFAWASSAVRFPWRLEVLITNTATNAQVCYFFFNIQVETAAPASAKTAAIGEGATYQGTSNSGHSNFTGWIYNTAAKDTTGALALVLNVINPSASASVETTLKSALIEVI